MGNEDPIRTSLLQGTVDVLILKALDEGPRHGYAVSAWIRERSEGALGLEEGALYQSLHRLEGKGWIASDWGLSQNNRRAKYYRLTRRGRRQLASQAVQWRRYAEAVHKVLDPTEQS